MAEILLIEPDRVLADAYVQALQSAGFQVNAASTAQAAIMVADAIPPDLVILEIQLVEHSGIEFLYEFRSYPDWQNVPVVIHTQVPPVEFEDSAQLLHKELGVQAYLYKPRTSLRGLVENVREQLPVATPAEAAKQA